MKTQKLFDAFSGDLSEYRSVPFWSWNDSLDEKNLTDQISEMKKVGIGGFIIHARTGLKTEYLGEKWFSCVGACLKRARELGMNAWIYDENGWPSGFVGGKLLKREEYRARFLTYSESRSFDKDAFCCYVEEKSGYRRVFGDEGDKVYHCVRLWSSPANTDILNPEVVEAFIAETHEKYYSRFADSFGRELVGFFTDEPQYYRWETPYPVKVADFFAERYGEDVKDGLIYLFKHDERGYAFRTKYYGALNEMYVKTYYKRVYEWCGAHGCKLTGHSVEEPRLYTQMWGGGAVMPTYEYEDVPGVDSLTRNGEMILSARQVGSVAAQFGKKHVLTEIFGCSGYDATPFELRHAAEKQYFLGVNLMCQHLLPYSVAGQGKCDCPPVFYKQSNWWEEFGEFNEYFTRLGYVIANTREETDVLVIHPMRSVWLDYIRSEDGDSVDELEKSFSSLTSFLDKNGVRYHLADEGMLAAHGRAVGKTIVFGDCVYDKVIVPRMKSISSAVNELLSTYSGTLCVIEYPVYIDGERAEVSFRSDCDLDGIAAKAGFKFKVVSGEGFVATRKGEIGEFAFVKNLSPDEPLRFEADISSRYAAIDLGSLKLSRVDDEMTLAPRGSLILFGCDVSDVPRTVVTRKENVTKNFSVIGIGLNQFVSDVARVSLDGVTFGEPTPLPRIFENALYASFRGKMFIKHEFVLSEKTALKLVVEKYKWLSAAFNGVPVTFTQSAFDIGFAEADVGDLTKEGVNEFVYSMEYYQRDEVRFAFFDPLATESLRNCLYYDAYIENVYLKGDFVVNDGVVSPRKAFPPITSSMKDVGYPFFHGEVKLCGNYFYNGSGRRLLSADGRFVTLTVEANGKKANLVYTQDKDITDLLERGENRLIVTVRSSPRNLFGPHHFKNFTEKDIVGPDCFTLYRTWRDGTSDLYDPGYNLVPFGVSGIYIAEEHTR